MELFHTKFLEFLNTNFFNANILTHLLTRCFPTNILKQNFRNQKIFVLKYLPVTLSYLYFISTFFSPKITIMMATKHHNCRFAGRDSHLQIGKSKNLPAGTVIDRNIVSPDKFDFYLMSSQGIQGTSIPTHYHVLHDDNELTADSAQVNIFKFLKFFCHKLVKNRFFFKSIFFKSNFFQIEFIKPISFQMEILQKW